VRAVVAVHLNGQSCDLSGLAASARTSGVPLLEDACHAIGGDEWRSGRGAAGEKGGPAASRIGACSEGLAACFSFHPVKTITTCEGGAVTTNDPVLADRMRLLRNHGLRREPAAGEGWPADAKGRPLPWYYRLDEPGFNYRLSDVQCALGQAQLARLDAFVSERRRLAARYDRLLAPLRERVVPIARPSPVATAWHLYPVLCKGGAEERADLYHHLKARNILAQVHYVPVTSHPYYRRSLDGAVFPGAQSYYDRVLSLPLYAGLAESDQDRVVDALTGFFR
jgi:dTDP-4-amino-4,6-dideoxygalactose transaminase